MQQPESTERQKKDLNSLLNPTSHLATARVSDTTSHLATARASDSVKYSDIARVISLRIIIIIIIIQTAKLW